MQTFRGIPLTQIQNAIRAKQESFPAEWLGRSLAYTPYQPRPLDLKAHKQPHCIYTLANTGDRDFLHQAKQLETGAKGFIVESLELAATLRRYISTPLIYDFLILDSYQLLEALVYGVDSIVLYPKYCNQKLLRELSEYAIKLGLERIFHLDDKEDLTKAIFAKADVLNLNGNLSLIPIIPKQKILISPIENNKADYPNALDAHILKVDF